MDEVLNSLEIPNNIGFSINLDTFVSFFDDINDRHNFIRKITKKADFMSQFFSEDFHNYVISLSLQSVNGKKVLKLDEKIVLLETILKFYSTDSDEFSNLKRFYVYDNESNYEDEIINVTKNFISKKIEQLEKVSSIDDLKDISTIMYSSYMKAYNEKDMDQIYPFDIYFKSELQKDIKKTKAMKVWIKTIYEELKNPLPNDLLKKININKLKMFMSLQYCLLSKNFDNPLRSILFDTSIRMKKTIDDLDCKLDNITVIIPLINKDEFKLSKLNSINLNELNTIIEFVKTNDNKVINDDFFDLSNLSIEKLSKLNCNEVEEYINKIIENDKIVDNLEIEKIVEEIKTEINNGNLSLDEYKKKKHQLKKLNMVFNEIKPKAIQRGIGIFDKFNVYYYENGMVAIDKIEYGARLFIMPITTYKYIIDNKVSSLRSVGKLDGVKAFKHDDRTDWLANAKQTLINGYQLVSKEDIKLNEKMVAWEFDYSIDDVLKLNKIIEEINDNSSYSNDEKKEKIEKLNKKNEKKKLYRKKAKEIDLELKESKPTEDLKLSESRELIECEDELSKEYGNDLDFVSLYEKSKKLERNCKRNPAVSKYCKDRTLDVNLMYHCEMCGNKYALEEKSRLDFHHLVPISEGGPDTIYNGLCLCTECHRIIHFEKNRISTTSKARFLKQIEKYIKDENPELLDLFYEYKRNYFPTINDILYRKRLEIKDEVRNLEINESLVDDYIDKRIENFEKKLREDYQKNPNKYDENFEIDWNMTSSFRK